MFLGGLHLSSQNWHESAYNCIISVDNSRGVYGVAVGARGEVDVELVRGVPRHTVHLEAEHELVDTVVTARAQEPKEPTPTRTGRYLA